MSEFGKLFKASRFASLAKPLSKSRGALFPTHQVVETRDAALSRQEWGLKYALPQKLKSRYIVLNDFDSLERIVDFEAGGGDHYRRLRFQELGIVPERDTKDSQFTSKPNPLFQDSNVSASKKIETVLEVRPDCKKKKLDSVIIELEELRPEFKEYVLKNHPKELKEKGLTGDRFQDVAAAFLKEHRLKTDTNKIASLKRKDDFKFAGTGGLSYALKGRLRTTPNGVVHREAAPARYVGSRFALGGFVAEGSFKNAAIDRTTVLAVSPTRATIKANGAVSIDVAPLTSTGRDIISKTTSGRRVLGKSAKKDNDSQTMAALNNIFR